MLFYVHKHYMKRVRIRSFSGPYVTAFGTDQKNSEQEQQRKLISVSVLQWLALHFDIYFSLGATYILIAVAMLKRANNSNYFRYILSRSFSLYAQ